MRALLEGLSPTIGRLTGTTHRDVGISTVTHQTRDLSEKIFQYINDIFKWIQKFQYFNFSEQFHQYGVLVGGRGGGPAPDNLSEERPKGVEIFSVRPERRGRRRSDFYNYLSMDL